MSNQLINLLIQSSYGSTLPVSMWSSTSTTTNTANATTRYSYDLNGITLTDSNATLTINSNPTNITFDGTIQGLANSLNSLNYGYFLVSGDTIFTQDDTNVYGNMVICPNNSQPAYIVGSPQLVFDFSSTCSYQNSGTAIADLSGNNNNGVFTVGAANGSPSTVTGFSTNGYLNLVSITQRSVRLPDSLKPLGLNPYTYIVYMQPYGQSQNGNFPGIISSLKDNTYDAGLYWVILQNFPPPQIILSRKIGQPQAGFNYNGGSVLGDWSVFVAKYDGAISSAYQYFNGVLYKNSVADTNPILDSSYGLFLGLNLQCSANAKINYVAMYNTALSDAEITTISSNLSSRILV